MSRLKIYQIIIIPLRLISFFLGNIVPINRQIILLHGSSLEVFNESSRYLFEHLVRKNLFKVFWITSSDEVYSYLLKRDLPVVRNRSFKSIWLYLRSGIVIGNGTSYPNLLNFVGRSTIKICLNHGTGIRSTNAIDPNGKMKSQNELIKKLNKYDYFNFTSKFSSVAIGKLQFHIPDNKRIVYGLPRCDHLFLKSKCEISLFKKNKLKQLYPNIKQGAKAVLYAPTWRELSSKYNFPLEYLEGFELTRFNEWLEKHNIFFFISSHPKSNFPKDLFTYNRIKPLSNNPQCDINCYLPEFDVLISDYSSILTDFMIMNRPVIFVMPDYEDFLYSRGLLEDIRLNLPGYESKSFLDLKKHLQESLSNKDKYKKSRDIYLSKYYDLKNKKSCDSFEELIKRLI